MLFKNFPTKQIENSKINKFYSNVFLVSGFSFSMKTTINIFHKIKIKMKIKKTFIAVKINLNLQFSLKYFC